MSRARRPSGAVLPSGFTLIEIVLVLVIIGILAAVGVPRLQKAIDQANVAHAIGDVKAIAAEVDDYMAANDYPPGSLAEIGRGGMEDPWGNPYAYLPIMTDGGGGGGNGGGGGVGGFRKDKFLVPLNSDYDLYSRGKDGSSQPPLAAASSQDDIVRANDGSYVGLASKY